MRLLVTRPQPDADRTAETLRSLGMEPVVAPLLSIQLLTDALPDLSACQALIFTSANAVRSYVQLGGTGGARALVVGDATAAAARAAGFAEVASANGDVRDLGDLIERTLDPGSGPIAHLRGEHAAGDGFVDLADAGFTVESHILYRAEAAESLPRAAATAIRTRTLDGVALYSPRSARTLMELILKAGLGDACRRLTAYCLSAAVAETLERPGLAVPWRRIAIAESPTEAGLIALIEPGPLTEPPAANRTMTAPILSNAEAIIAAFGGIRPMAKKLGVAVTTVQGWKERGTIPVGRLDQIREAAEREGIDLEAAARSAPEQAASADTVDDKPSDDPTTAKAETAKPSAAPDDTASGPWKAASSTPDPAPKARAEKVEPTPEAGVKPSPGKTPPPPIDHGPREKGGGWTRPFAFGAGVAIVLAIGIFLGWFLGPERPGTASLDDQKRLEATLKEATGKIADLEKTLAEARKQNAAMSKRAAEQEQRLAAVEKKASAPGGEGVDAKQLAEMQGRIDKAVKDVAAARTALQHRLAKLEANVSKLPAAGNQEAMTRIREATDALQKKLSGIEADISKLGSGDALKQTAQALKQTSDRIAAAEKTAAGLKARLDAAQTARQDLAKQIAALTAKVEEAKGNSAAALVAAIGQVRSQALSGQPFGPELETARGLAKDQPAIAGLLGKLADRASTGVPTVEALAAEFQQLAGDIVRASRGGKDGDWLDRTWARVRSSVVIRRTGDNVKGDTPEALVARAEAALRKGAIEEAVKLVAALPPGARKPAEPWLAKARARIAIETTSAALGREAVKLAAGQTGDKN